MRKNIIRLILIALLAYGFIKVIENNERFSCDGSTVVIQKGDDIWGLIEKHCTGDMESARRQIVDIVGGTTLQPGQTFIMPGK